MKRNFKTVLLLASTLMLTNAFGQCTKKTDDMTKVTTVETKSVKLGGTGAKGFSTPMYLDGSMVYLDGHYLIYLTPQFSDIMTIEKGSTVYIKLDDQSVLNLKVGNTSVSNHTSGTAFAQGTNTTIWYNTVQVDATDADVAALKAKKVVKIRVETEDYNIKKGDQFSEWIACIEKNK